jgi:hypothetical protein
MIKVTLAARATRKVQTIASAQVETAFLLNRWFQ